MLTYRQLEKDSYKLVQQKVTLALFQGMSYPSVCPMIVMMAIQRMPFSLENMHHIQALHCLYYL